MRGTDRSTRRWWRLVALLAVLAVVAAACGDDDDDDDGGADETTVTEAPADTTADTGAAEETTTSAGEGTGDTSAESTPATDDGEAAAGTVAGCEDAFTDPADLSPDREAARCEPGSPAPVPLAEPADITITVGAPQAEFTSLIQIAQSRGEFEAENLNVTIEVLPASEAWPLLGQGEVDAVWSGPEAAFHNLIAQDFDIKWVMGNYFPAEESQTGLWASAASGITEVADLEGGTIGSIVGSGSVIMYPIGAVLEEAGLSITDIAVQTIPPAEMLGALTNGAVGAAWILDPSWAALVDDPNYTFLAGQPPAEPLGGLGFGPTLLEENREAGVAFIRALIRTINTHFVGDYKADADLIAEIQEVQALDNTDALLSVPSLIWDWEIREGTSTRVQGQFIALGSVDYDEPLPETETIDRSFYLEATGHEDQAG
jgi:NitT/TauT family transport system substrate-binding protein